MIDERAGTLQRAREHARRARRGPREARYDAIVIGAGPSGLAAALRVAQAGKSVLLLERHSLWGGLNSFYKRAGRRIDVGLHALTNFVPPGVAGTPLARVLRQLRIDREALELGEQSYSQSACWVGSQWLKLRYANGGAGLREDVARLFPQAVPRFERLLARLPTFDAAAQAVRSARATLREELDQPLLEELLLLPACYYGAYSERDLPFGHFAVIFRSVVLEGLARPRGGVKRLLDVMIARLRAEGAELCLQNGVETILTSQGRVRGVRLEGGREIASGVVLSSAGWCETARLCQAFEPAPPPASELSFLEIIQVLDAKPAALGLDATVTFFNFGERLEYARPGPDGPGIDARSGVLCAPDNYAGAGAEEGLLRTTVLADPRRFRGLPEAEYAATKARCVELALDAATRVAFDPRPHALWSDAFTPRTIEKFSCHDNGAVYGATHKLEHGRTSIEGLGLIGTDQGYVGVVGAMLGGILQANRMVVQPSLAVGA